MYAKDLSNFSAPLTPEVLEAWKDEGFGLVIIQSVDPPPNYPQGRTRQQIEACLAAGLIVDAYIWLWFDASTQDIWNKLALIKDLPIRQLWLDVEDTAAKGYDTVICEQTVAEALELCDVFPTSGGKPTGIYTGKWFWEATAYMGNSEEFKDRKLWAAQYDGVVDARVFSPFGGWSECRVKQYMGSQPDGTDLNVLSDAEAAELEEPEMDCGPYKDAIERAVNRLQIELAKKTASGKPAALSKPIVREISSELFQALQS